MDKPNGKEDAVQVWLPAKTVERLRMGAKVADHRSAGLRIDAELFCKLNPVAIKRGDWVHAQGYAKSLVVEVGGVYATALWAESGGGIRTQVAPIEEWCHCAPPLVYAVRDRLLRAAGLEEVCAWD